MPEDDRPTEKAPIDDRTAAERLATAAERAAIEGAAKAVADETADAAEGLSAFQEHRWQRACELFEGILADWPQDGPARFYAQRCAQILAEGEDAPDLDVIKMDMK